MSGLLSLSGSLGKRKGFNNATSAITASYLDVLDQDPTDTDSLLSAEYSRNLNAQRDAKPHRLHVMATKHNTHITFKKMIDVLLSLSTGNIGFRKAGRGSYDAAYQLAAFVLRQMQEKGMLRGVYKMEVVLRGFGAGREAVTKAILGAEGRAIRGKISAVVDATRLKLGGPRSKKPRRLG
ncbi:translational machinery component [Teratosphaeria nubilosa]|uniref:Translational machinery component n=1 Tax=Teratosphaeria nubilosa TaxID=161662 RepID=A0A6G1LD06_9PEZI|nr:translational machinery component [Teratosphaeria nubilosa]